MLGTMIHVSLKQRLLFRGNFHLQWVMFRFDMKELPTQPELGTDHWISQTTGYFVKPQMLVMYLSPSLEQDRSAMTHY